METFHSIIGHRRVIDYLQESIRAGRVSHAYILDGPDGIGNAESPGKAVDLQIPRDAGCDRNIGFCAPNPADPSLPGWKQPRPNPQSEIFAMMPDVRDAEGASKIETNIDRP